MNFMKERTVTMNRECILEQAKQHDSFYLYEEAIIRKNTEQLKTDFPGVTFLYSVKLQPLSGGPALRTESGLRRGRLPAWLSALWARRPVWARTW